MIDRPYRGTNRATANRGGEDWLGCSPLLLGEGRCQRVEWVRKVNF